MRILLSCLQDVRPHAIPSYRHWADYFRNGLREAGHHILEVPGVDWAEGCENLPPKELTAWRERTWTTTLRFVAGKFQNNVRIDAFLSYLYPQQVEPSALKQLRKDGIPCVNFFCDNVREFTRVPSEYKDFDLHWVPEFEALSMYEDAGLKTLNAPMPAWVPLTSRHCATTEYPHATFVGSSDQLRRELLSRAIAVGADIRIGGAGWTEAPAVAATRSGRRSLAGIVKNQGAFLRDRGLSQWLRRTMETVAPRKLPATSIPPHCLLPTIDNDEYVRLTRESAVTLGINRVPTYKSPADHPLKYSRLRDLEAPMMGACYLTERTLGLEHLYDLGTEIETYNDADEMAAKIGDLQRDPARRMRIRIAGQRRALTDHTVGASISKMQIVLGLRRR